MVASTGEEFVVDVCMPTWQSEPVLEETLQALRRSVARSSVVVDKFVVIDNDSEDDTLAIVEQLADQYGWTLDVTVGDYPLAVARREAIQRADSDWLLFLDDDVRVREDYLEKLTAATAPLVGGVQGRKGDGGENAKWVRWRSHRAGTHATLVRREAVSDVQFPEDLTVLEDEYIRQTIEGNEYLWVFNHQARFDHANRGRHPTGWHEGYLAGKYDLSSFCFLGRKVPAALLAGKSPLPDLRRTAGWLAGWLMKHRSRR